MNDKYFILAWVAGAAYWLAYVLEKTFYTSDIVYKVIVLIDLPALIIYGTQNIKKAKGFFKNSKQLFYSTISLILIFSILFSGLHDIMRHGGLDRLSELLFVVSEGVIALYFINGAIQESKSGRPGRVPTGVIRSADYPEDPGPSRAPTPPEA